MSLQIIGKFGPAIVQFNYGDHFYEQGVQLLVTQTLSIVLWFITAIFFAKPVITFIVEPFEKLIRLFDKLGRDPLGSLTFVHRHKRFSLLTGLSITHSLSKSTLSYNDRYYDLLCCRSGSGMDLDGMEMNWLMSTIIQISSLLRVAYGKAGSDIIKKAIMNSKHLDGGTHGNVAGGGIFTGKANSVKYNNNNNNNNQT